MRSTPIGLKQITAAVAGAAALGLAACASNPVPDEKIAVAQAAVDHAQQAGAPQYAPVELASARDKLKQAENAAAQQHGEAATALAEQANVDAELAEATAQEQRSHKAAMELDASLLALRQEATAATQATQPTQPLPQPLPPTSQPLNQ